MSVTSGFEGLKASAAPADTIFVEAGNTSYIKNPVQFDFTDLGVIMITAEEVLRSALPVLSF
jgi:hypothetical protein